MAEVIKERERKTASRTELNFYDKETNEICYGFPLINGIVTPCKEGKEPNSYEPCSETECPWWKNYLAVKDDKKFYSSIETETWEYEEPAIIRCKCGNEVSLYNNANECGHCMKLYNLFGQELLPRYMWEFL